MVPLHLYYRKNSTLLIGLRLLSLPHLKMLYLTLFKNIGVNSFPYKFFDPSVTLLNLSPYTFPSLAKILEYAFAYMAAPTYC